MCDILPTFLEETTNDGIQFIYPFNSSQDTVVKPRQRRLQGLSITRQIIYKS